MPRAKTKGCQFCNNYDNSVLTGLIALEVRMHAGSGHRVTVGLLLHARTCKGRSQISRTAEPTAIKCGTMMGTGGVQKSVGPYTLHVRTCRMTILYLKNDWTDCDQIWYTDRDQ